MSWHDEDSRSKTDDWFSEPEQEWVEPVARSEGPYEDEPRGLSEANRRLLLAGLAALVAIVLVGWGIARIVGGEDEPAVPTTPTVEEPAPTPTTGPDAEPEPTQPLTIPEDTTLRLGDEGERVESLQRVLAELGYEPGPADGAFGAATADAVRAFQADAGLPADGIAGPQTLAALNRALAEAPG